MFLFTLSLPFFIWQWLWLCDDNKLSCEISFFFLLFQLVLAKSKTEEILDIFFPLLNTFKRQSLFQSQIARSLVLNFQFILLHACTMHISWKQVVCFGILFLGKLGWHKSTAILCYVSNTRSVHSECIEIKHRQTYGIWLNKIHWCWILSYKKLWMSVRFTRFVNE